MARGGSSWRAMLFATLSRVQYEIRRGQAAAVNPCGRISLSLRWDVGARGLFRSRRRRRTVGFHHAGLAAPLMCGNEAACRDTRDADEEAEDHEDRADRLHRRH